MVAVMKQQNEAVDMLLQAGACTIVATNQGRTLLHAAAKLSSSTILQQLLDRKELDVNAKDKDSCTALMLALNSPWAECAMVLLDIGSSTAGLYQNGQTHLHAAAKIYNSTILQRLLRDSSIDINARDKDGQTALMVAVVERIEDNVMTLLQAGASATIPSHNGRTVLHAVAERYSSASLKQLLIKQPGLDINAREEEGRTALMIAVAREDDDCTDALLAAGANTEGMFQTGETLLHVASNGFSPKIFQTLLDRQDLDINARDKEGNTALMNVAVRSSGTSGRKLSMPRTQLPSYTDHSGESAVAVGRCQTWSRTENDCDAC
eukprot:m.202172 g.202172  ORF g.202172 m.202172 type:complete len:322 (-) comp53833_c0_seq11:545-1510(-)